MRGSTVPVETSSCPDANVPDTGEAVLVVDVDPEVRSFLKCALCHDFERVDTACNAGEARALAQRYRFDVLVADIHLASPTGGLELARELREIYLDIEVVFTSGNGDLNAAVAALQDDAANLLKKTLPHRAASRRNQAGSSL